MADHPTRSRRFRDVLPRVAIATSVGFFAIAATIDVIYGPDDRRDVFEESDPDLLAIASSTVGLFSNWQVTAAGGGTFDLATDPYDVCPEEVFSDQPTSPWCSGFLVAADVIATAGHCVTSQADCDGTTFVFGFQMADASTPITNVPADDVYTCGTLLGQVLTAGADWALVQLDRPVTNGANPLPVRSSGTILVDTPVGVVGHPSGLPMKIADGAVVRSVAAEFFVANLDTYGGNSGSPVFNTDDFTIEGILVRGAPDFKNKACQGCQVSNECPDTGCRGEDVTLSTEFASLIP